MKHQINIRRKIILPHGKQKDLIQKLGYSNKTVTEALNCRINTRKANHVRREALGMGGVIMEVKEPININQYL
jgi:hypothetical protein